MTDYDKATGSAGTLRIRDGGSVVEFWILCSDPFTTVGSLTWSGVVNGSAVGGTVSLPAGFSSRRVGSWTVSTSQTVSFSIPATGTSGLGGPTTQAVALSRSSVPGAPGAPAVSAVTSDAAHFKWTAAAANGSPLTRYGLYVSKDDFVTYAFQDWVGLVLEYDVAGLDAGTVYKARVRAQNGVGTGPYSPATSFQTASGVRVSDGAAWKPADVFVSDGSTWKPAAVLHDPDGTTWRPAA